MQKQTILFLAANPVGLPALMLDEEAREIEEEIRRASQRDRFEFVSRLAARPMDLLRALREVKPSIVHFAGHAEAGGIYLMGKNAQPALVTPDALHMTFGAAGRSVQIVVLNGCATKDLAEALCDFVPVCVGTSARFTDDDARAFSIGFYGALASSESAARACLHGKAAMHLETTGVHDPPLLCHRRDVDPDALVLADGGPGPGPGAAGRTASGAPTPAEPPAPPVPATAPPSATPQASAPADARLSPASAVLPPTAAPRISASPSASSLPTATPPSAAATHASAPSAASPSSAVARNPAGTDLIAPLVLLQLSDLHFGPHSRFAGRDLARLAADCRQALDEARADLGWREDVGLVLVTGDIAEAARPPEYATAAAFFTALSRELCLPPHRFVFVPGNHDVSWTRCREVEGRLDDGEFPVGELRERLNAVKLAHFERFIRDFHDGRARHESGDGSVTTLRRGAFLHDFAELGISVAALNSCERESHRKADHVGALGADQAQAVLDHWRGAPAERIRIAAVHHNPGPMASAAIEQWLAFLRAPEHAASLTPELVERIATNFVGFEGRDELVGMVSDAYASLLFHGHHHASTKHQGWAWQGRDAGGPGDTRILSAGSWGLSPASGKLPKDQPVVMQLVRIDPAAAQLHPVLLTWEPNARLPGSVQHGRFLLDAQSRADRPIGLSLPPALRGRFRAEVVSERAVEVLAPPRRPPPEPELAAVIERYRARKRGSFERWDLRAAGPTPTTGNRPTEITLDEMYIPLRFAPAFDPTQLDRGAPIRPDDLLGPRKPQVVIGAAGSGKTTWMRWTFRRLIQDARAVPFFLELRAIAGAWKAPQDAARPIESYLVDALDECGASNPDAIARALLADTSGPRPVILIDGWDELGAHGERLRERLVELVRAFPHVVIMVSSRPYGETRPASAEAFETVYIQPLSDDDVRLLATQFHRRVHGHDELAGTRATDELMAALAAAPDARSLARTVLLLTMMLLLSREGPLPDRRHKLYTACLRNMLLHRVTQRERDGVMIDLDQQWRPDDSEERLRVVAELAYRMQTVGYQRSGRAPLVRAWDDAVGLLGGNWTRDQRERFMRWLVATAGVLIDRTDGSVQFAHLSFQEHLAAYYLFITREGDARVAAVRSHMGDRDWWETLRLWAGLIGDQWPDKLGPVLDVLRADPDAYWLAGQIFADGTGRPPDFEAWAAELPTRLSDPFTSDEHCASAWKACKQEDRRSRIAMILASARGRLYWLDGVWHARWCDLAGIRVEPARALLALETSIDSAVAAARSRVLHGASASCSKARELAILRLWPSIRSVVSVGLQTAISLGAQALEVATMLPPLLTRTDRSWSTEDQACARNHVQNFTQILRHFWDPSWAWHVNWDVARFFIQDFSRYFVTYFGVNYNHSLGEYFLKHIDLFFLELLSGDLEQDTYRYIARDFGRDLGLNFVQNIAKHLGRDFSRSLGSDFGFSESVLTASWFPTFALLEANSVAGRASPRAALAHGHFSSGEPLLALFRAACQASFAPGDASLRDEAARACDTFDGDSLWPALARHVARISTAEDRALLEDLARHPEQREPPLSWGLQHYVGGDLVLDDDSVVTLDELCARAGLPPLPFLEDMPDELDISLGDPS